MAGMLALSLNAPIAAQALNDAKWVPKTEEEQHRAGVAVGAGVGNIQDIVDAGQLVRDQVKGLTRSCDAVSL